MTTKENRQIVLTSFSDGEKARLLSFNSQFIAYYASFSIAGTSVVRLGERYQDGPGASPTRHVAVRIIT